MPGMGFGNTAVSPIAKTSGYPGTLRSSRTFTRPALSASTPSHFAAGEASTPAAQMTVFDLIEPLAVSTPSAWTAVTGVPSRTSTPSSLSARCAYSDISGLKFGSTRGPASISTTRASSGRKLRKSSRSVMRASSITAPASSTPVGPPPMIAKVRSSRRRVGSPSSSAFSNATSNRRRIAVASSSVLSPGA